MSWRDKKTQFATIRPIKRIQQEAIEHQQPDNYLQQMTDYKRLRKTQQKEFQQAPIQPFIIKIIFLSTCLYWLPFQLEEKHQNEVENLKARQDREFQQLNKMQSKDLDKLIQTHRGYLETKVDNGALQFSSEV